MSLFSYSTFGKWILAGEHSVLRGHKAIVFPLKERKIQFSVSKDSSLSEIQFDFQGESKNELELIFHGVLEKALRLVNKRRSDFKVKVLVESALPLGAGMGGSAALCSGLARLLEKWGCIENDQLFLFSKNLEDLFHGESSGVDVAASLHQKPIVFSRPSSIELLDLQWKPIFTLSFSGQKSSTLQCVQMVQKLVLEQPDRAEQIDQKMSQAVEESLHALQTSSQIGFNYLVSSIDKAYSCFRQWGLTEGAVDQHIEFLKSCGAVIAKPTGSGRGGYILALWPSNTEPEKIKSHFIKKNIDGFVVSY